MSAGWGKGSTRAWRRVRARVLARDDYLCQLNLSVCTREATHAHHLHGRSGPCMGCRLDYASHLVAACAPCNLKMGDPMRQPDPPAIPITRWG